MSISLDKKTGINLSKGSSISLKKQDKEIQKVCFGINWGKIQKTESSKAFFGLLSSKKTSEENVDLDASVIILDKSGKAIERIYFSHKKSRDGAIVHSGDDLVGDSKQDEKDNELISVDTALISEKAHILYFVINSFSGQDFGALPYMNIRIYEGTPNKMESVLATFSLSENDDYKGFVSLVLGKLIKNPGNNLWDFTAIGKPIAPQKIWQIEEYLEKNKL